MRYHEIAKIPSIIITNEEHAFIEKHGSKVRLSFLDEHQNYIANLLVRKGVYRISKDRETIVKRDNKDGSTNLQTDI